MLVYKIIKKELNSVIKFLGLDFLLQKELKIIYFYLQIFIYISYIS